MNIAHIVLCWPVVCVTNSMSSEGAEQMFVISVATRQMYCLYQDIPYHRVTSL